MSIAPKGNGKVVTLYSDFKSHITGSADKHTADQLTLSPSLTINTVVKTNVQDALSALNTFLNTVSTTVPPDASSSVKGIVKLAGDFSGTSASPTVVGIRGRAITSSTPTANQVLSFDGTNWAPTTLPNFFTAGTDLTGSSTSQAVVAITGSTSGSYQLSPAVYVRDALLFAYDSLSVLTHQKIAVGPTGGNTLSIIGQPVTSSGDGGNVTILGGASPSGRLGSVNLGTTASNIVEVATIDGVSGRKVLGLFNAFPLTATNVPTNGGDGVVFVSDATHTPTSGVNPSGGALLYSSSGKLRTKTTAGADFALGDFVSNPNLYGTTSNRVYTYSTAISYTSATNTYTSPYSFNMDAGALTNFMTYVEVTLVVSSSPTVLDSSAGYKLTRTFANASGTVAAYSVTNLVDTSLPSFVITKQLTVSPVLNVSAGTLTITMPATATGSDALKGFILINAYSLGVS